MAFHEKSPIPIAEGGTNATSMATTDGVVYYDGTRLVTTAVGTATNVLTSNGAGVAPTFQALPSSSISITGNTGGALTGTSFTFSGGTTGLSFGGAGTTETLTFAGITANGGTVSLATDATTSTINVGTGAGVKTSTFGSTNSTSATTVQSGSGALNITSTNGALTINSGTGALGISTDASATTVSFATGAAVKGVTLGSTNSTSATTVQSGSGALNVTSTNGALTINSGTGALGISTDASATTISIGTGGAVKGITLGSTNTTSSTAIKSGTGNVAINSGLTIDSTGRNKNTVQPCFSAYKSGTTANATGGGGAVAVVFDTVVFDQNSNYNNGTGIFTAPITGRYFFTTSVYFSNVGGGTANGYIRIVTTARTHFFNNTSLNNLAANTGGQCGLTGSAIADMTAGDTCQIQVTIAGQATTVGIFGQAAPTTSFYGYLVA